MRRTSARRGTLTTTQPPQYTGDFAGRAAEETAESRPKLLARPPTGQNRLIEIVAALDVGYLQSFGEMLGHTNRIGHYGKPRVHRPDAHEKAGGDNIQIVELMGFAVDIEN